jgi:chorismate lyase / 3-hydroxybenzoate synthase
MSSVFTPQALWSNEVLPVRALPPACVDELFARCDAVVAHVAGRWPHDLQTRCTDTFTLVTALADLPRDKAPDLADAVAAVYRSVAAELGRRRRQAVRLWNFVPDIQGTIRGAGDRYMAFNTGRFAAYCEWFGGPESFGERVPTSSAVGIAGDALWVHALACDAPGQPVENPRQVPAYGYSRRYGLRPPCFARATRVGSTLFIGGTASILGEQSHHDGDLEAQTRETLRNIAALIDSAAPAAFQQPLDRLNSLRVHVRDAADGPAVRSLLQILSPTVPDLELVQAPLCRKELLVEIEGLAAC